MAAGVERPPTPLPVELPFCRERIGEAFPLLQKGFVVRSWTGIPVAGFLTEEMGLDSMYVRNRITTIFLDGKPVDDIEKSIVRNGSLLALSGAMPGLVGATLRRGGYYSAFRETISDRGPGASVSAGQGTVTMKLFNILLREIGPHFLQRGVIITPGDREWLSPEIVTEIPSTAWATGEVLLSLGFGDDR
jgi:hypothetical protein